ncbi:hypothetical protein LQ948_07625 [Jiella sp. MQZ9-1]|uniref:Uncharacterized protein n=1 Tax=Jiella flava TaxID=2816857 RepID=A0A939G086_9HYPH|nr:hypothetical protein [Jiella flava]MBO0662654.1 hypothetical protein [Jiella flava]MCD2471076.1 hypothetical protein [Jiella flava]
MPDRIARVIRDIPLKQNLWSANVGNPYVRAYDLAYERYHKTLKLQDQSDKASAELLVFAASVATGSVLMAVFATASLRVLAGRLFLDAICNRELDRTFAVVHAFANNKTAQFALGAVFDESKEQLKKRVTIATTQLLQSSQMAASSTSINYMTRVDDFIRKNAICVQMVANGIQDDPNLSAEEKDALAVKLQKAPFFNPPPANSIQEESLAKKIELSFYMSAILDSDHLVKVPAHAVAATPGFSSVVGATETPIDMSPRSPLYPVATQPKAMLGAVGASQYVAIDDLGSGIRDRIDKLHREIFKAPFYVEHGGLFGGKPTTHRELVKAELVLSQIAKAVRPQSFMDVRS